MASQARKPADTPFKQQRLPAWQPILTPKTVIPTFFFVGLFFIPLGAILIDASNRVIESESVRYDKICDIGTVCNLQIEVTKKMPQPVYMYYELTNYYQNHRRYVKSRSDTQLRGDTVGSYSALTDCQPLRSVPGLDKKPENFYNPCGLIASSWFNDTFVLTNSDGSLVPNVTSKGIAWKSDLDVKFNIPNPWVGKPPAGRPDFNASDFENEEFIVWMRTAGLPHFRKLHRIIHTDLEKGVYNITIGNYYDVSSFSGSKSVVLSTTTWIGGKNPFLGWAYVVTGLICFGLGIFFLYMNQKKPRMLGDPQTLFSWKR